MFFSMKSKYFVETRKSLLYLNNNKKIYWLFFILFVIFFLVFFLKYAIDIAYCETVLNNNNEIITIENEQNNVNTNELTKTDKSLVLEKEEKEKKLIKDFSYIVFLWILKSYFNFYIFAWWMILYFLIVKNL